MGIKTDKHKTRMYMDSIIKNSLHFSKNMLITYFFLVSGMNAMPWALSDDEQMYEGYPSGDGKNEEPSNINPITDTKQKNNNDPDSDVKPWVWIVGGVAVLIVVGLVLMMIKKKKKEREATAGLQQ